MGQVVTRTLRVSRAPVRHRAAVVSPAPSSVSSVEIKTGEQYTDLSKTNKIRGKLKQWKRLETTRELQAMHKTLRAHTPMYVIFLYLSFLFLSAHLPL